MIKSLPPIYIAVLGFLMAFSKLAYASETPNVALKIAEYADKFQCIMPAGGKWFFNNDSGIIKKSDLISVKGILTDKALKKFHVMVDSVPKRKPQELEAAIAKWQGTGKAVHTFEAGHITYSPDGKTQLWDGRVVYIGLGVFENHESASKLCDELSAAGISNWIFEEIIKLSQGSIILTINGKELCRGDSELELLPHTTTKLKQVEFAKGYSWHGFAERTYKGHLKVRWGAQNALDVVLTCDLEELLAGIVPSEISSKAAPPAIQAQAVAARGEMLSKLGLRHIGENFDFCAEQHCQVYAGTTHESENLKSIIAPTRGLVLQNEFGEIVDAVYAANCGGHTEANHLVWTSPPAPHLAGVWDSKSDEPNLDLTQERDVEIFIRNPPQSWCQDKSVEGGDKFRWQKHLDETDFKRIEANVGVGPILFIGDFARGPSGRIYKITITGENGSKTVMKELAIRKLFGGLKSACFIAKWEKDKSNHITQGTLIGAGWGHGVGMCQTGAQAMGKAGTPFTDILLHYFPKSTLEKAY